MWNVYKAGTVVTHRPEYSVLATFNYLSRFLYWFHIPYDPELPLKPSLVCHQEAHVLSLDEGCVEMVKLVDVVREALRTKHYAYRTEKTYLHWIKQYVRFLKPVHPREAGVDGVKRFLTYLAVDRGVSFSTQNQALAALIFL
jgi:integrase-like protein